MIGERVEVFVETRNPGGWMDRKWLKGSVVKEWSVDNAFNSGLRSPLWGWEVNLDDGGTYSIHHEGNNWRKVAT